MIDEDDDESLEFEDALGEAQSPVDGTINAIEGRMGVSTLKLKGKIKNCPVYILLDTGSTHNVVDSGLAKRLGLKVGERPPLRLTVADNRHVCVSKQCSDLAWEVGDYRFTADFLVM